jgi:hypothetical protein
MRQMANQEMKNLSPIPAGAASRARADRKCSGWRHHDSASNEGLALSNRHVGELAGALLLAFVDPEIESKIMSLGA